MIHEIKQLTCSSTLTRKHQTHQALYLICSTAHVRYVFFLIFRSSLLPKIVHFVYWSVVHSFHIWLLISIEIWCASTYTHGPVNAISWFCQFDVVSWHLCPRGILKMVIDWSIPGFVFRTGIDTIHSLCWSNLGKPEECVMKEWTGLFFVAMCLKIRKHIETNSFGSFQTIVLQTALENIGEKTFPVFASS